MGVKLQAKISNRLTFVTFFTIFLQKTHSDAIILENKRIVIMLSS